MKKNIKFIHSIASATFSYKPGDKAMIEANLADAWTASGVAVPAEADPEDLRKQIAELQKQLDDASASKSKK
jgi:hypothetical protein